MQLNPEGMRQAPGQVLRNYSGGKAVDVLIVDDDETNRMVLEIMLRRDGHRVRMAKDGSEAVELYESVHPDLILMDIMMPVMDGYEAARRIKAIAGNHFVPIIFLTALTDEAALVKCLEVGGDDFITKPVSRVILRAKLAAAARVHRLYEDLQRQQSDLSIHHERLRYEHEVAEQVFAKIIGNGAAEAANIRSELLPLAITNGDLLLVAGTSTGTQHVMLGDCTGHGLSAAIGAIPVADIFYTMTRKGFGVREIALEMNRKLHSTLPTGQFLAACMAEWNYLDGEIKIWNGGVPDVMLVSGKDGSVTQIPSRNLPLGIVENEEFKINIDVRRVERGDRLYLYSDGLVDARDQQGRMFGQERLEDIISANRDRNRLFDEIRETVAAFRGGHPQDDDITLVEMLCDERLLQVDEADEVTSWRRPNYDLSIKLGGRALGTFDPLDLVRNLTGGIAALERHQSYLYTIIAELYTNALEHGVLGMDCDLKETPDGYSQYYAERERRLSDLAEGWIHIDVKCHGDDGGGELILQVEDSGNGFDAHVDPGSVHSESHARIGGRGLKLVKSLCKKLSYDSRGNYARAVYAW